MPITKPVRKVSNLTKAQKETNTSRKALRKSGITSYSMLEAGQTFTTADGRVLSIASTFRKDVPHNKNHRTRPFVRVVVTSHMANGMPMTEVRDMGADDFIRSMKITKVITG